MKLAPDFWQSKTTKLTIIAIVTAVLSGVLGVISPTEAVQSVFAALYGLFVRDALAKNGAAGELMKVIQGK